MKLEEIKRFIHRLSHTLGINNGIPNSGYEYVSDEELGMRLIFFLEPEEKYCEKDCSFQMPYGFVPEADCPIHDTN